MNLSSLIAERLKAERVEIGLNQAEAAEKVGVSREMWGKYERGLAVPGGEVLFSFVQAGADPAYLFSGIRKVSVGPDLSEFERELLESFRAMCAEDQIAFSNFAKAIKKK